MKRLILAATTAMPLMFGTAYAYTDAPATMVDAVDNILGTYGYDVDVEALTDAQISRIYVTANSEAGEADIRNEIDEALRFDAIASATGTSSRATVQNNLDRLGYDVNTATLSDEEVSRLYVELNSEGSAAERRQAVESILGDRAVMVDAEIEYNADLPTNSMTAAVQDILDRNQFAVDASLLTEEQMAQIYLAGTSYESAEEKRSLIEAALK